MEHFVLMPQGTCCGQAVWRSLELGELVFPSVPDPYRGVFSSDFWLSRHAEYNRLQWDRLDWEAVRCALGRAAEQIMRKGDGRQDDPELEFCAPTLRERTYVEMWFGFGEPAPVEARALSDGRYEVGYGQHRICAYADYPMKEDDRALMKVGPLGFVPAPPLPPETRIPVLVM